MTTHKEGCHLATMLRIDFSDIHYIIGDSALAAPRTLTELVCCGVVGHKNYSTFVTKQYCKSLSSAPAEQSTALRDTAVISHLNLCILVNCAYQRPQNSKQNIYVCT